MPSDAHTAAVGVSTHSVYARETSINSRRPTSIRLRSVCSRNGRPNERGQWPPATAALHTRWHSTTHFHHQPTTDGHHHTPLNTHTTRRHEVGPNTPAVVERRHRTSDPTAVSLVGPRRASTTTHRRNRKRDARVRVRGDRSGVHANVDRCAPLQIDRLNAWAILDRLTPRAGSTSNATDGGCVVAQPVHAVSSLVVPRSARTQPIRESTCATERESTGDARAIRVDEARTSAACTSMVMDPVTVVARSRRWTWPRRRGLLLARLDWQRRLRADEALKRDAHHHLHHRP
jgi:hypothetical protein